MNKREEAMRWWNAMTLANKVKQKNRLAEYARRMAGSLTGREIQKIYEHGKQTS